MIHIGNINVVDSTLTNICIERAKNFKTRGRDINTIIQHTIIGEAVELLVCRYFNLLQVDFDIMEYDAIDKNGVRYEIKHTSSDDKWWNYTPDNYSYFLTNAHKIDFIILCYHNNETGDIYLKFVAKAPTFHLYTSPSKFNGKHYYNVDIAARNNVCVKY